jgi:hypothetical protein
MTLTNSQWKCLFSWKDMTSCRWDQDLLRDSNNASWEDFSINLEFMESIWAIWFWPAWVKTQTNEIISWNDDFFDKKTFLFNS